MHWHELELALVDFEGSTHAGVLEFGAVIVKDGKIQRVETALCAPSGDWDEADARVHHIRKTDLEGCPLFSEYRALFKGFRENGLLAAHCAGVEERFLKALWAYPGVGKDAPFAAAQPVGWGPWVDTHALYKAIYPGLDSYKLGDLVERFRLQNSLGELAELYCPAKRRKPHCALYDALASALLLLRLDAEPGFEGMTIEWLLEQSLRSQAKRNDARQGDLF